MGPEQKAEGSLVGRSSVETEALGHMLTPGSELREGPESNRLCQSVLGTPLCRCGRKATIGNE